MGKLHCDDVSEVYSQNMADRTAKAKVAERNGFDGHCTQDGAISVISSGHVLQKGDTSFEYLFRHSPPSNGQLGHDVKSF